MSFLRCNMCCGDKEVPIVPMEHANEQKCVSTAPKPSGDISDEDLKKILNFFKHFDADEDGFICEQGKKDGSHTLLFFIILLKFFVAVF